MVALLGTSVGIDRSGARVCRTAATSPSGAACGFPALVYNYKTEAAGPSLRATMLALLGLGLCGHTECVSKLANTPVNAWAVVPSTKGRSKLHELVTQLSQPAAREIKIRFTGNNRSDRELHPELWSVTMTEPTPEHVLLIDDSWVTGAHAQGVASALKVAGVPQVSILTIAKILEPSWWPNPQFIKERLTPPAFDKLRCPWTGSDCP